MLKNNEYAEIVYRFCDILYHLKIVKVKDDHFIYLDNLFEEDLEQYWRDLQNHTWTQSYE